MSNDTELAGSAGPRRAAEEPPAFGRRIARVLEFALLDLARDATSNAIRRRGSLAAMVLRGAIADGEIVHAEETLWVGAVRRPRKRLPRRIDTDDHTVAIENGDGCRKRVDCRGRKTLSHCNPFGEMNANALISSRGS